MSAVPSKPPAVVHTIDEVRSAVAQARRAGRNIAFVPTMGALHAGHVSLIAEARKKPGAFVVVSIFVNPMQFGEGEDFAAYPRTMEYDVRICAEAGVDLVFAPTAAEMYPPGDQTRVKPGPLAETLCGAFRPGHFEGVCTVVAKLFNIVQPDAAYFGQKDAQQAAIIRRMVADLFMPVRVVVCPLVRDSDGLALSSRNARLSAEERSRALALAAALERGKELLLAGGISCGRIIAEMRAVLARHADLKVEYLSVVDPETLSDLHEPRRPAMLAGAIRVGDVRLIDNVLVDY